MIELAERVLAATLPARAAAVIADGPVEGVLAVTPALLREHVPVALRMDRSRAAGLFRSSNGGGGGSGKGSNSRSTRANRIDSSSGSSEGQWQQQRPPARDRILEKPAEAFRGQEQEAKKWHRAGAQGRRAGSAKKDQGAAGRFTL